MAYGGGENIRDQLRAVEYGADVIVAAPGRLVDFMERGKVRLRDVMFLTLDEADRCAPSLLLKYVGLPEPGHSRK